MNGNEKHACRLCYYETTDTVQIFGEQGNTFDYKGKIAKYLYLLVSIVGVVVGVSKFCVAILTGSVYSSLGVPQRRSTGTRMLDVHTKLGHISSIL